MARVDISVAPLDEDAGSPDAAGLWLSPVVSAVALAAGRVDAAAERLDLVNDAAPRDTRVSAISTETSHIFQCFFKFFFHFLVFTFLLL
jgi:hypothetical protein